MEAKKEMNQLVYLIAFGSDCLEQFKVCYEGLKLCDINIMLITDQEYKNNKITIGHVKTPTPPPNGDVDPQKALYHSYFTFRTKIQLLTDINKWDQIWYMDTDFVIKEDIFLKYKDSPSVLLCKEPNTYISNEHFCGALTTEEVRNNLFLKGINAGIYCVPKEQFYFFTAYHDWVQQMIKNSQRAWLCEQHILNMFYVRFKDTFKIKTFKDKDIGFPQKGTDGMVLHYACYKFEDKLKLMRGNYR